MKATCGDFSTETENYKQSWNFPMQVIEEILKYLSTQGINQSSKIHFL